MTREEKEKLFFEHQKLATHYLFRATQHRERDMEDIIQELKISLWINMEKYNPERAKFSTFAMKVFRSRLNHHIQDNGRQKRKANSKTVDSAALTLMPSNISVEKQAFFNIAIESLDESEKKILDCLLYMDTTKDMEKKMNMSPFNFSQSKMKLYRKIKGMIS